ncbi:MAG: glycerophosphodiester phosphodiesterase [Marinifilaceae bacterium]
MVVQKQIKVIAHRGHWEVEGAEQNSISSLKYAGELGVYGSEFDVWLTEDDVPVVHHDSRLKIGVPPIEKSTWNALKHYYLANGEEIPTLEQYLQIGRHYPDMKLILEIKKHSSPQRSRYVARRVLELVEQVNLVDQVEYISFSKSVIEELAAQAPYTSRSYVKGGITPAEAKAFGATGIDYPYKELLSNPEWVTQAHDLGMTVNCWTVNHEKDMRKLIDLNVDMITTDKPTLLTGLLDI